MYSALEPGKARHPALESDDFSVHDKLLCGLPFHGFLQLWISFVEIFLVAREEPNLSASAESEAPHAVNLALENPFGIGEVLIGESRKHRTDPSGLALPNQLVTLCLFDLIEKTAHRQAALRLRFTRLCRL